MSKQQAATTVKTVRNNALRPMDEFKTQLTMQTAELAGMLPPHVNVERFKRIVLTAVAMNPDLLGADRRSLFIACHKAAADGLVPDAREAVLVIYKGLVQYQPMYQGLLKVVRNSGDLASISAHVVREKDRFSYTLGDDEKIIHSPFLGGDAGATLAVYAIATTKDGARYRDVMSRDEVEKVRKSSRAPNSPAWVNWWDEMAKKTVLRRLSKILPKSTDREVDQLERVIAHDDEATAITETTEPRDVTPKPARHDYEAAGDTATSSVDGRDDEGGDHEVIDQASASVGSPGADAERSSTDEAAEREADRMQSGDDADDDDLTVVVMKNGNDKADTARWLADVNEVLGTIDDMERLSTFDAQNSTTAKALGATTDRNYRTAIQRAARRIQGGAA